MSFNTNTDIWFAGAFAAFTVDLLVYPLDTLKTRIQSPNYKTLYRTIPKPSPSSSFSRTTTKIKTTPLNFSTLLSRHTHFNPSLFRGLYQGISTVIFVTIPSSGAFFTTYEALKSTLNDAVPPNSTLYIPRPAIHALSSGGAELVSCLILTPAEVLKQNAQVWNQSDQKGGKSGNPTLEVIKQFRSHPTKLFRGYTTLAARNLPFTGLQFPLFEHLKSYFLDRRKRAKRLRGEDGKVDGIFERARITALSAGLAGTGAAWITTPIDVVKTRVMLAAGDEAKSDGRSTSSSKGPNDPESKSRREPAIAQKSNPATSSGGARQGAFELTKQIVQTEGVRGLFRGAMLRSVWTALGSGLYLGAYEGGRFWLEERRKREEGIGVLGGKGTDGVRKDWKGVKVGIGRSRSQGEKVGRSAWEE